MPVSYQKLISREDLLANPNSLYLFGDNEQRSGMGGQAAAMRGEKNAVGIRTKRWPSTRSGSYWSDDDFEGNCEKINRDLVPVRIHLRSGGIVVMPIDGIGTGLANLRAAAPKTFAFLQHELMNLEQIKPSTGVGSSLISYNRKTGIAEEDYAIESIMARELVIEMMNRPELKVFQTDQSAAYELNEGEVEVITQFITFRPNHRRRRYMLVFLKEKGAPKDALSDTQLTQSA